MSSVRRGNWITWWGSRLALLALALQFGLSLGHVHDSAGAVDHRPAVVAASAVGHGEPGLAPEYCGICASIAALAGGALPGAPVLSVPAGPGALPDHPLPAFLLAGTPHLLARPRGPPGTLIA